MKPVVIGVGGPVGSGKTLLIERLTRAMNNEYSCAVITNDIYIKEKRISGLEFMDYLYNVDVDFKILTEGEILEIQNNIINKYKECSIDE